MEQNKGFNQNHLSLIIMTFVIQLMGLKNEEWGQVFEAVSKLGKMV